MCGFSNFRWQMETQSLNYLCNDCKSQFAGLDLHLQVRLHLHEFFSDLVNVMAKNTESQLVLNIFMGRSFKKLAAVPPSVKFMFSKKATKIDEIFTVDLTLCSKCQINGEDFVIFCGLN